MANLISRKAINPLRPSVIGEIVWTRNRKKTGHSTWRHFENFIYFSNNAIQFCCKVAWLSPSWWVQCLRAIFYRWSTCGTWFSRKLTAKTLTWYHTTPFTDRKIAYISNGPTACLYSFPPVLNGHLQRTHSNESKNNLSSKTESIESPVIDVSSSSERVFVHEVVSYSRKWLFVNPGSQLLEQMR